MAAESPARITRVVLKNYKSIVHCDVELKPLTILVGPNGSGKSNFVDALRFVSEALTVGLEQAIRNRGNVQHILSEGRAAGESSFSIDLGFRLADGYEGRFAFEIESTSEGGFRVMDEALERTGVAPPLGPDLYSINQDGGSIRASRDVVGQDRIFRRDRLFLVSYSGTPEGRPVYDLLTSMAFYDPSPAQMRVLRPRDPAARLAPDGVNVASMLRRIQSVNPDLLWRLSQYLRRVLPGLEAVTTEDLAGRDLLRFSLRTDDDGGLVTFDADQMSDGTLRALGVLVALFQHRIGEKSATSLVAIEEPENNLHPAAGGALLNALLDASYDTQVLVTTHSTSLLDSDDIDVGSLRAVVLDQGRTRIGPIDHVSKSILEDHMYTAGELLQLDQMRPERATDGEVSASPVNDPSPAGR